MALLKLDKVSKIYEAGEEKVYALNKVCFEVLEGDFAAVCGPSGSGKSTLLSVLGVLTTPSEGVVTIDDVPVYELTQEKRADFRYDYIGFIFQSFQLVPYLTAMENVMLPLAIASITTKEKRDMAAEVLGKVGLGNKMKNLPNQLSGGQIQRVAVARAIVNKPSILLADEPTGNLDTKTGDEIIGLMRELNSNGETILMVTHDEQVAKKAGYTIRVIDGAIMNN